MKKAIPISLAHTLFYVEDDETYTKLENYLSELQRYFSRFEDSKELMSDIESRIREQLLDQINKVERIITLQHVDQLIKNMGRPSDFDMDEETTPFEETWEYQCQPVHKKLYRNKENSIIAGVSSGIAAYFRIDPLIIRSAFFCSIFFGGIGILLYFFLWFAVPAAKTANQKLEMYGDPVTLNEFVRKFKKK